MTRDMIPLSPIAPGASMVHVGDSDYAARAFVQCRRHIALLRRVVGLEPPGARLRVRRSDQEFDPYIEVVVEYDGENSGARAYAFRCDEEARTQRGDLSDVPPSPRPATPP